MRRVVHVQTDALRSMIPEPDYSWAEGRFVYESMYLVGRQALKSRYDVILDGTFLKEGYRSEAEMRLKRHCADRNVVCVLCDRDIARERNADRENAIPEDSFDRLSAAFEKPASAIFVSSDRMTPAAAASHILESMGKPGKPDRDTSRVPLHPK
jgi:predicted kinase